MILEGINNNILWINLLKKKINEKVKTCLFVKFKRKCFILAKKKKIKEGGDKPRFENKTKQKKQSSLLVS